MRDTNDRLQSLANTRHHGQYSRDVTKQPRRVPFVNRTLHRAWLPIKEEALNTRKTIQNYARTRVYVDEARREQLALRKRLMMDGSAKRAKDGLPGLSQLIQKLA